MKRWIRTVRIKGKHSYELNDNRSVTTVEVVMKNREKDESDLLSDWKDYEGHVNEYIERKGLTKLILS